MKQYIPWILVAILALLLWFKGCQKEDKPGIDVIIPEQSGEFEPQPPVYIDRIDTLYITRWKTIEIPTRNPVNDSLALAYQQVQDSLERYKMFLAAIQLRNFVNEFEDEFIKITSFGEVQGQLNYIGNRYTVKERKVNAQVPETFLRGLIGFEIGNNTLLNDFRYKASLGLQNANGNIYRAGYGFENLNHYIYLGMDRSIFNWKK